MNHSNLYLFSGFSASPQVKGGNQKKELNRKKAAIFLDRDGVINYNRPDYVKNWAEFCWLPKVLPALQQLATSEYKIIVVTNQSPIGRGIFTSQDLATIHTQMCQMIVAHQGRIDGIFYCPHRPEEQCSCRKPKPGLLIQAAKSFNLSLANSFMIGDAVSDMQAAQNAGCYPLFVLSGRHAAKSNFVRRTFKPCQIFPDLAAAVRWILDVDPENL
jgi:D-glycero-D-manno-heptose 1,7-bisphosphate phosphatase